VTAVGAHPLRDYRPCGSGVPIVQSPSPARVGEELGRVFGSCQPALVNRVSADAPLFRLLREAAPVVAAYFPGSPLRLRLVTDPESAGRRQLFLLILTSLPAGEALERLDRLDGEWWLKCTGDAGGRLSIDIEFSTHA
jgi:hypothetical protein